jgi:environmental stress-induced protein Ves
MSESAGALVLAAGDRVALPWLNGGGVTREAAARPLGGDPAVFDWRLSIATIAGENEVASLGVREPTLDLNLMTRRDRCSGTLVLAEVSGDWTVQAGDEEDVALILLDGSLRLGDRPLAPLDGVLTPRGGRATVRGTARVAVARVVGIRR